MAKRKATVRSDILTKTEAPAEKPLDPVEPRGIALRHSEWEHIDAYAKQYGMKAHALSVILLRRGLADLLSGKIKTKTQETLDV